MTDSPPLSLAEFQRVLSSHTTELKLDLDTYAFESLHSYWCLFVKWNRSYNLSAIRDPKEILLKHIVDSLSVQAQFQAQQVVRCIDVGTGGGLPGIVLAICNPSCQFTLLDSAGKKMRFLFQVCETLGLSNVSLENRRVESLKPEQGYDVVISRAFASIQKFTSLTSHLLADNGQFWAMKGVFPEQELSEMEKHYKVVKHHSLSVPGVDAERCLICIDRA